MEGSGNAVVVSVKLSTFPWQQREGRPGSWRRKPPEGDVPVVRDRIPARVVRVGHERHGADFGRILPEEHPVVLVHISFLDNPRPGHLIARFDRDHQGV